MAVIAIFESDALVALDIAKTLRMSGHSVRGPFYSLQEFLAGQMAGQCGLAIVDMDLLRDRETVDKKATGETMREAGIPVVLITALSDEATLAEAKTANPFGILVKPFSAQELKSTIDVALYRASMEGKLASSERRYRELFDFSMTARCIVDFDGQIVVTNKAFRDLFGLSEGMNLKQCLAESGLWTSLCERLAADSQCDGVDLAMTDLAGAPLHIVGTFSSIASAASVEAGTSTGAGTRRISAEFYNDTEPHRLREELHQAQKMEAMGRLAGGVAHDFNNILTAILGHSEMLKMDIPPQDPLREDVEGILQATDRARQLTQQLLSFSRKQPYSPRKCDAGQIVRDSAKLLRKLVGEGIFFSVFVAEGEFPVYADSIQIEQALINLVANARDALENRPDPRITLLLERKALTQPLTIRGVQLPEGAYATIEVADNGVGMSSQVAAEAFEPYFTTKMMGKGTGLGLAIVSSVATSLSGAVELDTEPGKGTNIVLWIPLLPEGISDSAGKAEEAVKGSAQAYTSDTVARGFRFSGSPRILVVDDDESLLGFLVTMLGKAGAEPSSARNGGEALLMAENNVFDIFVIDINLPGISGVNLYERLSAQKAQRCVFMTGRLDVDVHLPQGVPLLQKPFTPQILLDAIEVQLQKPRG